MIYHFVVGDFAAQVLKDAFAVEQDNNNEVVVLRDLLNVGPLVKKDGIGFSEMRTAFWTQVLPYEKMTVAPVDDMERLLEVSAKLYKNEADAAWFWMAPLASDISAYYWLLPYLSKHKGRFNIVNIAGLPFLNDDAKVFFPKSVSELPVKEVRKARKLSRAVTLSEIETDIDEWKHMQQADTGLRIHDIGKKIVSKEVTYYDAVLFAACSGNWQKASKIVNQVMSKNNILATGDLWLAWRLLEMRDAGQLQMQGALKTLKDFEFKWAAAGKQEVTAQN